MISRTKPEYWKLEDKSSDELFKLAINKLKQRTVREGEKLEAMFEAGDRDEKQRSKFYAIWYAFEALRIYGERKGIKIAEPYFPPPPTRTINVPRTWEFIEKSRIFIIPAEQWRRFSKEDQKFLRSHQAFELKQLGYPLIHTDDGTFFDWGTSCK